MGLGMAASAAGGAINRNSALNNAQSQADARNGALSNTINGLDSIYNKTNAPAFSSAVGAVTPGGLQTAQDARVANNVGAITKPDVNAPAGGDAPPAVANASTVMATARESGPCPAARGVCRQQQRAPLQR
jgi:hypothetical protein